MKPVFSVRFLLVWLTASACLLGLRQLYALTPFVCVLFAYGFCIAAVGHFTWERHDLGFLHEQPGHTFCLMLASHAIWVTILPYHFIFGPRSIIPGYNVAAVFAICICLWAMKCANYSRMWKAGILAFTCTEVAYRSSAGVSLGVTPLMHAFTFWMMSLLVGLALLQDIRLGKQRDWIHWGGLTALGGDVFWTSSTGGWINFVPTV